MIFKNRGDAGRELATKLKKMKIENPIVIGLPRGGVPVAAEIARFLHAPMDVLIVRKLGAPQNPEFAIGALTEGDFYLLNPDVVNAIGISKNEIQQILTNEELELERRVRLFRGSRHLIDVRDRTVIIVDDGLATGFTAAAAVERIEQLGAKHIILAVPVCSNSAVEFLSKYADEVIYLKKPDLFMSVGNFYVDFPQLTDEEVISSLSEFYPGIKSPQEKVKTSSSELDKEIRKKIRPLRTPKDLESLIDHIKDKKIVMLGEASHGTQEFYQWRKVISEELISKHGFNFIAIEGDWPPCQQVNQYVLHGKGNEKLALDGFRRWPTWMWGNTEVQKLIHWMNKRNHILPEEKRAGFYGLDVYSLFESIEEVLKQVEKIDKSLAGRVRAHYECFDPYQKDEKKYVRSLITFPPGCEDQVVRTLQELLEVDLYNLKEKEPALFDAIQNARIIKNAESYYRTMVQGNDESWNVRDRHMMETLNMLLNHHGRDSKAIVWAHNTHIGDYRATDMVNYGHINIGGLAREEYGESNVALVGFGTYTGTVTASHAWGAPTARFNIPSASPKSYEAAFHSALLPTMSEGYIILDEKTRETPLVNVLGHRAIGVVYDPNHERGNYVPTSLAFRYDAFLFFDRTQALAPLGIAPRKEEMPETYPQGY